MTDVGTAPLDRLRAELRRLDRVVIAFSGGVDSGLLAYVALEVLGPDRVQAATAVSASLADSELEDCRRMSASWKLPWCAVETDELNRSAYVANGADRCYHCKSELMDRLAPVAERAGAVIALGVNLDDLGDHRPGQVAARERGAVFPLVDAGLDKAAVRAAARHLGLEMWDKPAAACLASRLPYGTPVTLGSLGQVAAAEAALRALGYRQLRVRHYGDLARLELEEADLGPAAANPAVRAAIVAAVRGAGYRYVTLDLEGFRSGNLNSALA